MCFFFTLDLISGHLKIRVSKIILSLGLIACEFREWNFIDNLDSDMKINHVSIPDNCAHCGNERLFCFICLNSPFLSLIRSEGYKIGPVCVSVDVFHG